MRDVGRDAKCGRDETRVVGVGRSVEWEVQLGVGVERARKADVDGAARADVHSVTRSGGGCTSCVDRLVRVDGWLVRQEVVGCPCALFDQI